MTIRSLHGHKDLTSGQVAKICDLSPKKINTLIDTGMLPGFKIPGSGHRRICRKELLRFMQTNGYPLSFINRMKYRVLVVMKNATLAELLARNLPEESFWVGYASNLFDAGVKVGENQPDLVVISGDIGVRE